MLSVKEVAEHLNTTVKIVRKLIRLQRQEDAQALHEGRQPAMVGLRANSYSPRHTRIREGDVVAFQER